MFNIDISPTSWPWYISGPLLGLFVPILIIFFQKQLGVSSGFRAFWSFFTKRPKYFDYDVKKDVWQLFFGIGCILAGAVAFYADYIPDVIPVSENTKAHLLAYGITKTEGFAPEVLYNWNNWWLVLGGGIFIGFGARLGNGCTAGHCIMGVSQFSLSSIVTTICFFIGGLIATYFLLPILLS